MSNNWISRRHMREGGSINRNPKNNGSDKGPLRHVVDVRRYGEGMFDSDWVVFECGHEGRRTCGAKRGRCRQCKIEATPTPASPQTAADEQAADSPTALNPAMRQLARLEAERRANTRDENNAARQEANL